VHDAAGIRERHVRAHEHVIGYGLPEDFDAEDVSYYFFGFALDVGVDKGDVVVGGDDVTEGGEALFYSLWGLLGYVLVVSVSIIREGWGIALAYLDFDLVWYAIS
jgi:hypothetical protein